MPAAFRHPRIRERLAQASVEAAILFPSFLTLLLLCIQPVCVLYTRSIMESAASEAARLMITASGEGDDSYEAFVLRRLAAVPDLEIFHAGGPLSWEIELSRAQGSSGEVSVKVSGYVSPLPILGAFVSAWGESNAQGDVLVEASASYAGRPSWLEGDYDSWVSIWED